MIYRVKIIIFALLVFTCVMNLDARSTIPVQVRIIPTTPIVGEPAELRLVSNIAVVEVLELPIVPGLKWNSNRPQQITQTSVTRRQEIYSTVFTFTINKEGSVKIPAIKVKIGHQIQKIPALTVKAQKQKLIDSSGKSKDIDELLYISAVLMNETETIFVGEEIPLEIRMYSVRGLPVSCSWPTVDIDNIMLKDYGKLNPDNPNFLQPVRRTVKLNNKTFNVDVFKTSIRPIAPGLLTGDISIPCIIKVPRDNNQRRNRNSLADIFNNDFFGSRYRKIKYNLHATLKNKTVESLPEMPSGSYFLGLVGEWSINTTISTPDLKSGDPITLKVNVTGRGTLDTLNAPELKIPGFTVYPPEIKKDVISPTGRSRAEVRYALIPLEKGPVNINLAFSYFSPNFVKYKDVKYNRSFNVKKGKNNNSIVDDTQTVTSQPVIPYSVAKKNKLREGILYLKRRDSGFVKIPLYRNKIWMILFFLFIGPALLILTELFYFKKQKLSSDPLLRRKSNAKKRKSKIIEKLKLSSDDELANVIQNDITPYLNDMLGYPPGTTSDELAGKVDNKDLSLCLESGSTSTYMPGVVHDDPKKLREDLVKLIQKIAIIAIIFVAPLSLIGESELDKKTIDLSNPLTAYDTEHFKIAEDHYRKGITSKQVSPAALYNLGNCLFQQGKYAEALLYYERAHLLDPVDSDIIENLNFIRRKLSLPEINNAQHPIVALKNMRDEMRPDTWLLIISIIWSLCWIILLFRRVITEKSWHVALSLSIIALVISIFAYYSQVATTYSPKNGIVINKNIPIYSLPTDTSKKSELKLLQGAEVQIEEKRHSWIRVRNDNSEGWVKANTIQQLWPY